MHIQHTFRTLNTNNLGVFHSILNQCKNSIGWRLFCLPSFQIKKDDLIVSIDGHFEFIMILALISHKAAQCYKWLPIQYKYYMNFIMILWYQIIHLHWIQFYFIGVHHFTIYFSKSAPVSTEEMELAVVISSLSSLEYEIWNIQYPVYYRILSRLANVNKIHSWNL